MRRANDGGCGTQTVAVKLVRGKIGLIDRLLPFSKKQKKKIFFQIILYKVLLNDVNLTEMSIYFAFFAPIFSVLCYSFIVSLLLLLLSSLFQFGCSCRWKNTPLEKRRREKRQMNIDREMWVAHKVKWCTCIQIKQ